MSEDFAVNLVINVIKQAKSKGRVTVKDDLAFRMAITIIMKSSDKTKLINRIKKESK